jgi:hypothetical protein
LTPVVLVSPAGLLYLLSPFTPSAFLSMGACNCQTFGKQTIGGVSWGWIQTGPHIQIWGHFSATYRKK